ncbi:unknown [Clostridium sp. CAG:729]|nr:unknown [Clostridium sp. CAG:729]
MVIKKDKHRFVVIIEKDTFENFKAIAEKEKRSASNLAAKMIEDYVKQNNK